MKFLIDTHIWLWWDQDSKSLSPRYYQIIEDPTNNIFMSTVVVWELAIKYNLGKIKLPEAPAEYIDKCIREDGFSTLPITHVHAQNTFKLNSHHKDPFDRMLISQSQVEDIPLLTQDKMFTKYDVNVIDYE